jgi:anti-anti-sigma regulatory factor
VSSDCDIQVELDGRVWVVSLHGQHHQATVDRLDDEIEQVVATGTTIVFDLTDVTFVDGYLVAAILRWANRAQISDHEALAVVVGEAPSVAGRGFNIVLGSTARLPCFATKPEALTALSEASAHNLAEASDPPPRAAAQPPRVRPPTEVSPIGSPGRPSSGRGDARRIGDQRSSALVHANDVRRRRASLKHRLKTGEESLAAVLLDPPDYLRTARVETWALAAPGLGKVKARNLCRDLGILPRTTIGRLTERQRNLLAAKLSPSQH